MNEEQLEIETTMEQRILEGVKDALRNLEAGMDEKITEMEEKVEQLAQRASSTAKNEKVESARRQERRHDVEQRMEVLEESVQRALKSVFPTVKSLMAQLDKSLPPGPPSSSTLPSSSRSPAPQFASLDLLSLDGLPIASMSREQRAEALVEAVRTGNTEHVMTLLRSGVDVNTRFSFGVTALHEAAANGHPHLVDVLIRDGADVSARTARQMTPLHAAAGRCHRCVSRLIEAGADVNSTDVTHATPLHAAAHRGNVAAARWLLQAGANTRAASLFGTPLDVASTEECRRLLQSPQIL